MDILIPFILKILQNNNINDVLLAALIVSMYFLLDRRLRKLQPDINKASIDLSSILQNTNHMKNKSEKTTELLEDIQNKVQKINDLLNTLEKNRIESGSKQHNELLKTIYELEKLLLTLKGDITVLKNILDRLDI